MNIKLDNVYKLLKPLSSNQIILDAAKMFLPKWKSKTVYLMAFLMAVIPAYLMSISEWTVVIFKDAVQLMNDIILALFGIVFTGYALFQALIGEEMLIRMINTVESTDREEKSKLQESNELFAKVMMMEFICIVISVLIILILSCIPETFNFFDNAFINEIVAGFGICLYLYISFVALFEIKSFIFNIFQLFNFHAGTRVMEILKNNQNNDTH